MRFVKKLSLVLVALLTMTATLASPAGATNDSRVRAIAVTVTVENLAPAEGTALTPVWIGLHDGSFDLYDRGEPASPGLESLAEDGATGTLSAEFAASGAGTDTTIVSSEGIPPLLPGETGTFTLVIDAQRNNPQYLSYASMVLPSNDAFVANGDPTAIPVINERGRFVESDVVVTGAEVLDAGTEVNDELEATTAFFGQAAPNTGTTEGAGVELHPGFIPEGRILSEPRFQNADFTVEGYEALRITTEAEVIRNFDAELDGDQTVPAVDTEAEGWARFRVLRNGDLRFTIRANDLDGLTVAHIHLGAPGETGPVAVDLLDAGDLRLLGRDDDRVRIRGVISAEDLVGPLDGGGVSDLLTEIANGNAYVNLHTDEHPAGEIRADLELD